MPTPEKDTQWVHESDYGSFEPGMLFGGLFAIVVGLVQLVIIGIKKLVRR